ncbi:MAG: hypothetical protein F6K55_22270 [Moorea sp. SIO4A3]|nr:hypothetical protein [Moorena sp. SIO4A3]
MPKVPLLPAPCSLFKELILVLSDYLSTYPINLNKGVYLPVLPKGFALATDLHIAEVRSQKSEVRSQTLALT